MYAVDRRYHAPFLPSLGPGGSFGEGFSLFSCPQEKTEGSSFGAGFSFGGSPSQDNNTAGMYVELFVDQYSSMHAATDLRSPMHALYL